MCYYFAKIKSRYLISLCHGCSVYKHNCSGAVPQLMKTITACMSWNNALLNVQIPHQYCMGSQNIGVWCAMWVLGSIVLKPACLDFTCQCTGLESDHCCVVVIFLLSHRSFTGLVWGWHLSRRESYQCIEGKIWKQCKFLQHLKFFCWESETNTFIP